MAVQSTYSYRARDSRGEVVTGSLQAASSEEVCVRLRGEGKYVLDIYDRPMRKIDAGQRKSIHRSQAARQVKRDDVIAFCQQLAVMLETGVPLSEALDAFCHQATRREFKMVLSAVREDIYAGEPFSRALMRWPRVFPSLMVSLMKASEASGTMALMLDRIGQYLDKERRTAKQIRGALGYPMFMMLFGSAMTIFLVTFVLPRFAKIYDTRAAVLPAPTRILLGISNFISSYYMYYIPALAVTGALAWIFFRRPTGRRCLDWARLNLPVLRGLFSQLYLTRVSRTMGTLLMAGVNLLDIIDLCRGVTSNRYYADLFDDLERGVRDGKQISDVVLGSKVIPPNVASMIASGERSGQLAQVMERVAQFAESELEITVKRVTGYLEPIMIILMGVIIGGLAIALLLPIFSMGRVMTGT